MAVTTLYEAFIKQPVDLTIARQMIAQIVQDIFTENVLLIDIAVNEALQNSIDHRTPDTDVYLSIKIMDTRIFLVQVSNEGDAFDVEFLKLKARKEDWESGRDEDSGRGVMIMHKVFDKVIYSKNTTEVLMLKYITSLRQKG